jgi:type IV/VI secretion system ImpK/VasF family protein
MPTSGSTSSRRRREPGAVRRPTRAARDLAAFVSAFGAGDAGRELSASALNNQLLGMLDRFAKSDDLAELQPDDVNECRFALVAWIDEVIHRSNWPGRAEWAAEPLQKRLYRTSRAGNEFYEHLQRLRPDQLRVREIYLLVLTLGFEGQYSDQPAERRALIAHQYETLRAARVVLESDREPSLTPSAYELEIDLPARGGGQLVRTLVGIAVGLVVIYAAGWITLYFVAASVPLPRGM